MEVEECYRKCEHRKVRIWSSWKSITQKTVNKTARVTWLNNDPRRPTLLLFDKGKFGEGRNRSGPCVRIIPSRCPTTCPIPVPTRNPIRCNMWVAVYRKRLARGARVLCSSQADALSFNENASCRPDSLNHFLATMIVTYLCKVTAAVAKKLGHGRISDTTTSLQMSGLAGSHCQS